MQRRQTHNIGLQVQFSDILLCRMNTKAILQAVAIYVFIHKPKICYQLIVTCLSPFYVVPSVEYRYVSIPVYFHFHFRIT